MVMQYDQKKFGKDFFPYKRNITTPETAGLLILTNIYMFLCSRVLIPLYIGGICIQLRTNGPTFLPLRG
jgi:hypothetical protein